MTHKYIVNIVTRITNIRLFGPLVYCLRVR